jgi:hypothetical protein
MGEDKLDHDRINMTEPCQRRAWMELLNCTEQELRAAVNAVGPSPSSVRDYLALHKQSDDRRSA